MVLKYPVKAKSKVNGAVVLFDSVSSGRVISGPTFVCGMKYSSDIVPVTDSSQWEILEETKMKTKEELIQEIDRLKSEVEQLKDDKGLRKGDKYWSLTPSLEVVACRWDNSTIDHDILAANNVFLSEAKAEKESRHRLFEAAVTMRFKELGGGEFIPGELNYVIATNLENNESLVNANMDWHVTPRDWYTQDKAVAEKIRGEFDFVGWARGEL